METKAFRNRQNVEKRWQDICKVLGVPFTDEMVSDDFYLGALWGQQKDHLDSLGLINRGFCPLCGVEPIGTDYYRTLLHSSAVEYLCEECYKRTNPHLTTPGYTRRYYTGKILGWAIMLGVLWGLIVLFKACVKAIS
jgi:hypothetical protein